MRQTNFLLPMSFKGKEQSPANNFKSKHNKSKKKIIS